MTYIIVQRNTKLSNYANLSGTLIKQIKKSKQNNQKDTLF